MLSGCVLLIRFCLWGLRVRGFTGGATGGVTGGVTGRGVFWGAFL